MNLVRHPDRASWLLDRRKSLGGSDAATLCGHGYGSEYELWADKIGALPMDDDGELPEYVEAGQFMEPGVIAWWSHRTGIVADPTPFAVIRNDAYPWAHASPDALVGDDAGLDAKTADVRRRDEFDEALPLGYQIQAQHYLAVTNRARWHFATVVGGNRLNLFTVERDAAFIDKLMTMERQWWETHVVGRTPPEPDGSEGTQRAIRSIFPRETTGDVRPLDQSFLDLRDMLLAAKAEKKTAEDEIAEIEAKIKAAIGESEFGALPGGGGWQWKVEPRKEHVVKASSPRVLRWKEKIER